VIKHAGACRVEIGLTRADGRLLLRVQDDGVGGAAARDTGSGLRSLADRLDAAGGQLELSSPPGGGTVVTAELPCGS
jgi:signal transduction histidine kinase